MYEVRLDPGYEEVARWFTCWHQPKQTHAH